MEEKVFSRYFKAFGDPTRLRIIVALSSKEMTVNEIVGVLGVSQPTVSRHLALLRDTGVVTDRRDGQRVYYSLNKVNIRNCCNGFCGCLAISAKKGKKC